MKLKQSILLASALIGGLALPQAQAQTSIPTGSQALLAGFDFDNILGSSIVSPNRARYSDIWGNNSSPTALTAPGGLYFNGTFGSDNIGSNVVKTGTGDINRDILTRTGTGSTFDLGGQTGGEGAADFSGVNIGTASLNEFAINITAGAQIFENIKLSLYGRDSNGQGGSTTINWAYSLDSGATKVATGLSSTFSGAAFANSEVDFFGTGLEALNTALKGSTGNLTLIGTMVETGNARLNIDNIGVYGVAATAIPEPSTYAAIIAALTMGVVALRRRKQVVVS